MALYAIGDLHLSYGVKPRGGSGSRPGPTGGIWKNREAVFRQNCLSLLTDDDTLVLAGDISFGKNAEECAPDFAWLACLPGKKILLRGNHDRFWDAKKTPALNAKYGDELFFLQNNFAAYGDWALVGTKGYCFEGPFYLDRRGRLVGWDEEEERRAGELVERELERLGTSFEAAKSAGYRKFILFLHYPPTSLIEKTSGFCKMAEEYGASQVIYAHSHGEHNFHTSIEGMKNGVFYRLVSGDCLRWRPEKILE